jgi:hypothetical protein
MVDALRRAHRIVEPNGFVVDLHPSAVSAILEVGNDKTGFVTAGDAPLRHAAAGVALAAAIQEGLFAIDRSLAFTFYTYGASAEELKDYVAEHWRNGCIDDDSLERTRAALRRNPGARPRIHEQVYVTKLRAMASTSFPLTVER